MLEFKLKRDEYVVMKSEAVLHGGGILGSHTKGLVLTNQCLVLISRGLFGNTKHVERSALSNIKVIDGRPQAVASDTMLEIYFRDGHESFGFQRKREAKAWAENICKLLDGDTEDFRSVTDKAIPGAEYVAESLKDTLAAVKRPFRSPTRTKKVAGACASCGASVSGVAGRVVRCDHCGSDQQLSKR